MTTARRCSLALACATLLMATTEPSRADSQADAAARAFDDATRAFAGGNYRGAARLFWHAYGLTPHGDTAYNAGLSWERAGDRSRAAEAYAEALGRDLADEARTDAQIRLGRLRRVLALLTVTAPDAAEVTVEERTKEAPAEFYVEPGRVIVRVVAEDDSEQKRTVTARAGRDIPVAFDGGGEDPTPAAKPSPGSSSDLRDPRDPWPAVGWVAVGTSAALGGVWFFLNSEANSARDEFNSSDRTDATLRDRAQSLDTWTNVAGIGAITLGVAGVGILVFDAARGEPEVRASVTPAGASVSGRF